VKKFLLALLGTGLLCAEPQHDLYQNNLIFDPYFSPYAGADDLLIAHRFVQHSSLERLTDLYQTNPALWAQLSRAAELVLFWDPVNYMAMATQHEVFGHGYRARSIPTAKVDKYTFNVPPPYGRGGAVTYFLPSPKINAFQLLNIYSGGVEATAIFANKIRMQWLKNGQINPRQNSLYLLAAHDLTYYATLSGNSDGNDMDNYLSILNYTYAGSHLTRKSLAAQSLVNLLDPITYYSVATAWKFIRKGTEGSIPMISIGSYKYLPGARLGLTPFGPEYYLENFLVKDNRPIYFYLRNGRHVGMNYMGCGIENPHQWDLGSFQIGYRADLWVQPAIDMDQKRFTLAEFKDHTLNANTSASRFGASVSLIAERKLWKTGSLFLQVGGKSRGYLPGESLDPSLIVRAGITLW
jgi:hypothetical protein